MSITLERLEQVKKDVTMQIELIKMDPGWDMSSINNKVDIIQIVLVEVEKVAKELGDMLSAEKKKLAVDTINAVVDIPILPEWMEAKIIEQAIDLSIAWFNKLFGHTWLGKLVNG